MKNIVKWLIVGLLAIIPFTAIAQEESLSSDTIGSYNMEIASGTFEDEVLTLVIDDESIAWSFLKPTFMAGLYSVVEFAGDWAVENVTLKSVFVIDGLTAELEVSFVSFDNLTGELVLKAVPVSIETEEAVKGGPAMPETFTSAKMFFLLDSEGANSMLRGFNTRITGTRTDKPPCTPAARAAGKCS